ncbi:MAG: phosphoribosylanthranilate isomerase [Synechococcaceae cyanobacterium]|nr:phosphoribosylanthranilate isomerase [Synechococcaceae cyanobacterium]
MARPSVKICGLTREDQAGAVARLGADAIGVIGVPGSPRWVAPDGRARLFAAAAAARPDCFGVLVVADPEDGELAWLGAAGGHRVLQLHGQESPERCAELRRRLDVGLWKALRIRSPQDLERVKAYSDVVDGLLLDAWVPGQLGGSGQAIPLPWLRAFRPALPWWLAGGLTPERLPAVLTAVQPDGLDLSSGVEEAPGLKNLERVAQLFAQLTDLPPRGDGEQEDDGQAGLGAPEGRRQDRRAFP